MSTRRKPKKRPVTLRERPSTGEVGIANPKFPVSRGFQWTSFNPDVLVSRKGLEIYDEMRRDEQVKACLLLKKAALIGPGWQVKPGGEDARDEELATAIREQLQNLRGCFEQDMAEMLSAIVFGWSLTEKCWDIVERKPALVKLKTIAPYGVEFKSDPLGNVQGIRQQGTLGGANELPPEKFVHFVWNPEFSNPYGSSDLREIYRAVWHKKNWIQWLAIWGEQLSDPPKLLKHAPQATPDKVTAALQALQKLQANAAVGVPLEWAVELLEGQRDPKQGFLDVIDHHNAAIGKGMLTPDKAGTVGGEVKGGSYALAKTQFGAWLLVQDHDRTYFANVIQEQLIDQMAAFLDPAAEVPVFGFNPMTDEMAAALAELYIKAVAGNCILPDLQDENDFRGMIGLTPVDDERAAAMEQKRQERVAEQIAIKQATPPKPDGKEDMAERVDLLALPTARDAAQPVPGEFWRTLTPLEARADMAEKRQTFEAATQAAAANAAEALDLLVADVRERAKRALRLGSVRAVEDLEPASSKVRALKTGLATPVLTAYETAGKQARGEIRRARKAGT